jgi:hypothetical protein
MYLNPTLVAIRKEPVNSSFVIHIAMIFLSKERLQKNYWTLREVLKWLKLNCSQRSILALLKKFKDSWIILNNWCLVTQRGTTESTCFIPNVTLILFTALQMLRNPPCYSRIHDLMRRYRNEFYRIKPNELLFSCVHGKSKTLGAKSLYVHT